MIPPIEQYIRSNPDLVAIFGDRIQAWGHAFQGTDVPYATWQIISGSPDNTLHGNPDGNSFRIQFDVFGKNVREACESADVLMETLQNFGYVVSFNLSGRDPETKLIRYSFDAEFII